MHIYLLEEREIWHTDHKDTASKHSEEHTIEYSRLYININTMIGMRNGSLHLLYVPVTNLNVNFKPLQYLHKVEIPVHLLSKAVLSSLNLIYLWS